MVLDIMLTDYCRQGDQVQIAPGTLDYTPAPVWSPDSALLIENREDENRSKLVIIDLNQHVS
jgi:hypothetical protein